MDIDSFFNKISILSLIKDANNFKIDIFTQKLSYVISHINNNSNEDNNKNFKKLTNNLKSNFGLVSDIVKYLGLNLNNILSERIFLKKMNFLIHIHLLKSYFLPLLFLCIL